MSQGPSTFGIMITSSLSPISETSVVRSSSIHGLSSEFTRVQSWQSPTSSSRPSFPSPSHFFARSGSLAAIFALLGSKKWIMREGRNGISRGGIGAPIAFGRKKSFALRMASLLVQLDDADGAVGCGLDAQVAQDALVE